MDLLHRSQHIAPILSHRPQYPAFRGDIPETVSNSVWNIQLYDGSVWPEMPSLPCYLASEKQRGTEGVRRGKLAISPNAVTQL